MKQLGDPSFCDEYDIQYPYISGAMANGIASTDIVEAMGRAGMFGFFGSAGLSLAAVEAAIGRIQRASGTFPYGFNLIHSPNEPDLESAVVDLYLRSGISLVEASAFLSLTKSIVRYRLHNIHESAAGDIVTPNRVIAKVSRVEVAAKFMSPAPDALLAELVADGALTPEQANLARRIPVAGDVTVEADSGGHTDNQPAITLVPTMIALRDRLQAKFAYPKPVRIGAGGGVATPASAAAFFAMGAAYLVSGSVNQCTRQAGTSDLVRKMLCAAEQADVTMAPAADMFEMGVKVQVLKRGTMFAMRAAKLYDIYRTYDGMESIPGPAREQLEKTIFRDSLDTVWKQTESFFRQRDPQQLTRAAKDPKHKMALVFRWYLGMSSRWANAGEPSRQMDYQIWCGPAMGAFNEWVKGSFLEKPEQRDVVTIAMNILFGAAIQTRINTLRYQGVGLSPACSAIPPMELSQIKEYLS